MASTLRYPKDELVEIGRDVGCLSAACGRLAARHGNYYDYDDARLGIHQDKDEVIDRPVVSLSIGDSCLFRFGNTANRGKPYSDVTLASGDAFEFGDQSRFAYHGVPVIHPNTADPSTDSAVTASTSPSGPPA